MSCHKANKEFGNEREMARQKVTSKLLSDILDIHGLNKFVSKIKQRDMRLEEYTETYLTDTKNLASGGYAEGTVIRGSDSDVMNIIQGVTVVEPTAQISSDKAIELVMISDDCSPGYVKLEVKHLNLPVEYSEFDTYSSSLMSNLKYVIHRIGNKLYFSSKKFKEVVKVEGYTKADNFTETGIILSGPAYKNKTLLCEVDYVVGLEFDNWPKPAREWLNRKRLYQWPEKELLGNLPRTCQCYVVPTADESCSDTGLQWRMSFVSIERELIWHMNDTQLKCFIILKMLLKSIENDLPANTLKTYHLKNTMFWLLENTQAETWNTEMLAGRVSDALKALTAYVRERKLPQYLLPENNLFKNRFLTATDIVTTITALQDISTHVLQVVRAGLEFRHVQVELIKNKERAYYGFQVRSDNDFGNFVIYISKNVSASKVRMYKKEFLRTFPGEAKQFLPSINIAIARALYTEQLLSKEVNNLSRVTVDRYCQKASPSDSLRSCIYLALFDFHEGKFGEIKKRVEKEARSVIIEKKENLQEICLCVADNYFVPNVIMLEQVLKGSRWLEKYDQLVLAYLLMFLAENQLGHETECNRILSILQIVVDRTKFLESYFAHLNCLGYCYILLGETALALETFRKSLQKFPSVVNAAIYHIAFMMNKTPLVCR